MPSTERLPSGRYRGLYVDADGKKCRVPGTFGRKSDAKDRAVEAEAKAKRQASAAQGTLSAKTHWGDWWDLLVPDRNFVSDTSIVEAGHVRNFLRPQWGTTPLNKIQQGVVQEWVDKLTREGRSPSYIRKIYGTFRTSIAIAVERKILTADPCSGVKLPKVPKKPKVFLEPADFAVIAKYLPQPYRDVVEFMLETGFRPNEALGAHAHRVANAAGVPRDWFTAAEVLVSKLRVIRPFPKDPEAREVPATSKAKAIVRRQLAGRDLRKGCGVEHSDGTKCAHPIVFLLNGEPIKHGTLWKNLTQAAKAADADQATPYGSRRGYATRLAEGGLDAFAIADLMGHSDVSITREYVQRTQARRGKVLAALGERQPLKVVEPRGTEHGTDRDNQPLPEAPKQEDEYTA